MTQADIQEYLKNNGPATGKEIAREIDVRYKSVMESLRRMSKFNEVEFDKITNPETGHQIKQFKLAEDTEKVHVL